MKRQALLITAFVLSFFILKAQDEDYVRSPDETPGPLSKKFSLTFSAGPAFPIQDYGSKNIKGSLWDFTSPDSTTLRGFALTGFHFDLSLSYLITDEIGIIFYYGGNSNSFDINSFSSAMGYPASNATGAYYTAEYLVGPFINFTLSNKFSVKLNAMIGLVTNTYPVLSVNTADTFTVQRTISGGAGLGYSFSAGAYYKITDSFNIFLNVSYTGSTINYPGWTENDFIVFPTFGQTLTLTGTHSTAIATMQTGIIKPTIGIELNF